MGHAKTVAQLMGQRVGCPEAGGGIRVAQGGAHAKLHHDAGVLLVAHPVGPGQAERLRTLDTVLLLPQVQAAHLGRG